MQPRFLLSEVRSGLRRNLSMAMSLAWVLFAGWAAWVNFTEGTWAHWGLVITSIYLISAGIVQQIIPARRRP